MRNTIYIIIYLLIVTSCNEKPELAPSIYRGICTAKINGTELEFSPRMTKSLFNDTTYHLQLDYFIEDQILRKLLYFVNFQNSTQKQILSKVDAENNEKTKSSFATRIADGDVFGNYYYLNEIDSIQDYLQLMSFDKSTGRVVGKFQASFIVNTALIFDYSSPDNIVITDGYFDTVIFKE